MRQVGATCCAMLIALLVSAGSAGAQAPAPVYGGQLLYSTVTVKPGEIKTWTVTCPPGSVAMAPWIAPPPRKVTVTERIAAWTRTSSTFRAVSQSGEPQQITVAITCLKVRPPGKSKRKVPIKVTFTVTPPVRVKVKPNAAATVKLTCPDGTRPLSVAGDTAPVGTKSRVVVTRGARIDALPLTTGVALSAHRAEVAVFNPFDVETMVRLAARCGALEDADGEKTPLPVVGGAEKVTVSGNQQTVTAAPCPAGSAPVGAEWSTTGGKPAATLPFPREQGGLFAIHEATYGDTTLTFKPRCVRPLRGRFGTSGRPPAPFESGLLAEPVVPVTPSPTPVAPVPELPAVGTGTAFLIPGQPAQRGFTLQFVTGGTGVEIQTPGAQPVAVTPPAPLSCTIGTESVSCSGAVQANTMLLWQMTFNRVMSAADYALITLLGPLQAGYASGLRMQF